MPRVQLLAVEPQGAARAIASLGHDLDARLLPVPLEVAPEDHRASVEAVVAPEQRDVRRQVELHGVVRVGQVCGAPERVIVGGLGFGQAVDCLPGDGVQVGKVEGWWRVVQCRGDGSGCGLAAGHWLGIPCHCLHGCGGTEDLQGGCGVDVASQVEGAAGDGGVADQVAGVRDDGWVRCCRVVIAALGKFEDPQIVGRVPIYMTESASDEMGSSSQPASGLTHDVNSDTVNTEDGPLRACPPLDDSSMLSRLGSNLAFESLWLRRGLEGDLVERLRATEEDKNCLFLISLPEDC